MCTKPDWIYLDGVRKPGTVLTDCSKSSGLVLCTATFQAGVKINCQGSKRLPNTSSVAFIGNKLEGYRILSKTKCLQASVGAACHVQNQPSPILLASGIPVDLARNTLRLSVGRYTTEEDIDVVVADLKHAVDEVSNADTVEKKKVWKPFQGYR
ncbi:hypothetical protein ScPMuIL_008337 [Solemya velum]